MKLLPARTSPPSTRLDRRHHPAPAGGNRGYREYRYCLRWEFGFTCGFCLLHEGDWAEHGSERLGLMSVEHFIPTSVDKKPANVYENCFYACRLCNGSRQDAPTIDSQGRRLLQPEMAIWAEHFKLGEADELIPMEGDADAAYTSETYDLNDPQKVWRRRARRERYAEWQALLVEGPRLVTDLLRQCEQTEDAAEADKLLQAASLLRVKLAHALRDWERYRAVPADFPSECRCRTKEHHSLPAWLEVQTLELDNPASSS